MLNNYSTPLMSRILATNNYDKRLSSVPVWSLSVSLPQPPVMLLFLCLPDITLK